MSERITYGVIQNIMNQFESGEIELPDFGDLSFLSDQEIILLITKFPRSTCPIFRGLNDMQRTFAYQIMRGLSQQAPFYE